MKLWILLNNDTEIEISGKLMDQCNCTVGLQQTQNVFLIFWHAFDSNSFSNFRN